jgi:Predicted integral membrane protein
MTSLLFYLIPLFIIAVVLDLFFVKGLQRFRKLKKESTDKDGILKISQLELLRQAFWGVNKRTDAMNDLNTTQFQRRLKASRLARFWLEWLLIILIAYFYSASTLLNFDDMKLQQTGEHTESATLPILAEIGLWHYGEIPLWNPYMLTGFPHTGDMLGHFWNPVSTIPILLWGGINGMKVSIFLTFIVAGLGQWVFAYAMRLRRMFRLWSSILFMLSGGLALLWRVGWYELLLGAAWFPWCFALYLRALQRHTWPSIFLASAAVFMVISTGGGYYPIYLLVCMAVLFAVACLQAVPEERLRQIRSSVLVVLFSAALSAVVILPFLNVYRYSGRDVPVDLYQSFSQPIQYGLMNYVIHTPEWFNTTLLGTAGGWNWFYIGWLPVAALMLVPLAFSRSPRQRWAILISGVLFLVLLMWFSNRFTPIKKVYDWIPFLYNLRFPNRLLIIAASPLLILSALGLEYTYRLSKVWAKSLKLVYSPSGKKRSSMSVHYVITALWIIGLISTTRVVYDVNQSFAFIDQLMNPKPFAALRWLKNYDKSLYYVNIGGGLIYWEWTPAAYSLEVPMINFLYSRHLRSQELQVADTSPFMAQAKYQISLPDQTPPKNAKKIKEFDGVLVWQVPDVLPYAFSVQSTLIQQYTKLATDQVASVKVKLNGPNQVIARGTPKREGDVLVVLMSNYPGWKLLIDGKPAQVTPYNGYLGARMLPGEHSYVFYFLPVQFIIGASISIMTLVLITVMLLASPLRVALQKLRQTRFPSVYPNPTA